MESTLEPFDESGENGRIIEVARAEAAIVLSIEDGTAPPAWATNIFESFVRDADQLLEEEFAGRWVPDAQVPEFDPHHLELLSGELPDERLITLAAGFPPTADERVKFQLAAVRRIFEKHDELAIVGYGFFRLHAPGNRECVMMYVIEDSIRFLPVVNVRGYFTSEEAARQQLSSTGVLEEDFNAGGVLTLPGPREEVAECASKATWPKDLSGGGGDLGRAIRGGLRRQAARWFSGRYFQEHFETPTGTFEVECTYGQGEGFDIQMPRGVSGKGQLREQITYP